jgi:hypothetical protein
MGDFETEYRNANSNEYAYLILENEIDSHVFVAVLLLL